MRRLFAPFLMLAWFAQPAPAQQGPVPPFADAESTRARLPDEERVWFESVDVDRALRRSGALYDDKALDAYLQALLERLYPEFKGVVRMRVVREPGLNAFALPNGSLYINMGLVARLENEAQLATVLAHEAAHFVHRHSFQNRENLKGSTGLATVLGVAGGVGGALVGSLAAMSSVYGYSRELEREADRVGFERIVKLGYDWVSGSRVFELLAEEAKILDVSHPVFFASHPQLEERVQSYRELGAAVESKGGETRVEVFLQATVKTRADWPREELARGKPKSVIHVLSDTARRERYPDFRYWLGEAYRVRGEPGDSERAIAELTPLAETSPVHPPALRTLGLLHMKNGNEAGAAGLFRRYLEVAPHAPDAAFVKQYLGQLEQSGTKGEEKK